MPSVWIIFAAIHFNQTASQNKALHAGAGPRIHADCQASVIGLLDLAEKGGDFFEKKVSLPIRDYDPMKGWILTSL